jgi:hypothetical protein
MVLLGALLLLLGFILVLPRGGLPGATAARNVRMGMQGVFQTPGYQQRDDGREPKSWKRVVLGLGLIGLGVLFIALG